jgi:ParB family transcriptional regulator, chromosome partitioning protein
VTNQPENVAVHEHLPSATHVDRLAHPISVEGVVVQDRLRAIDPDHVSGIAVSMADIGQQQPIVVAERPYGLRLVAGLHRLAAARLLGWKTISAVLEVGTDEELRLVEIDENLARRNLSELDRAIALFERKRIYEELHPETKNGGDRRSAEKRGKDQNVNMTFWSPEATRAASFNDEIAGRLGISTSKVQRITKIGKALTPEMREALSGHAVANNQAELLKLAKLSADERGRAIELLTRTEAPAHNVGAAVEIIRGHRATAERSPEDKAFERLIDLFGRAPKKVQRRFIEHLQASGKLDDLKGGA